MEMCLTIIAIIAKQDVLIAVRTLLIVLLVGRLEVVITIRLMILIVV
jgi:hypothetical protein